MNTIVRLTCEQCTQRKRKCDKGTPCSSCRNAGITCSVVERSRLPRGQVGRKKDTAMHTRVARLEAMMQQITSREELHGKSLPSGKDKTLMADVEVCRPSFDSNVYLANEFWSALQNEVAGIRDILETDEPDFAPTSSTTSPESDDFAKNELTSGLWFGRMPTKTGRLAKDISANIGRDLLDIYEQRVDKLVKIFDWPSVSSNIARYADQPGTSPSIKAVSQAIYFAALCSITDEESELMLQSKRSDLLEQARARSEYWLVKADLLQKPELVSLQAFTVYLLALRSCTTSLYPWTLLAIAVRLATVLRLDSNDMAHISLYEQQMRRRLWFAIALLDTQLALDRGTVPIIPHTNLEVLPLRINDSELPRLDTIVSSQGGFTEMTFSCTVYEAMICQRKLQSIAIQPGGQWGNWDERWRVVASHEESMTRQFGSVDSSSSALERFTSMVARGTVANTQLMLRRPLLPAKEEIVPPWDDFDLVSLTSNVLRSSNAKQASSDFAPWAWFTWVKWYALAVLLAELCGRRQGADVEEAYAIAQDSFERAAEVIADGQTGMLWRLLVKLMERVRYLRGTPDTQLQSQESLVVNSAIPHPANDKPTAYSSEPFSVASLSVIDPLEYSLAMADVPHDETSTSSYWNLFINDMNPFESQNQIDVLFPDMLYTS